MLRRVQLGDPERQPDVGARTETADKGRAPQWEHRALLGFERGKHATETFFARRRVDVQLWAEAGGFGKFFGGEDALLAQADFKLSELVSNDRWGCELPMRDPRRTTAPRSHTSSLPSACDGPSTTRRRRKNGRHEEGARPRVRPAAAAAAAAAAR